MSLIRINNLTFSYNGAYDSVFENLCLNMDSNWRIGLTGRNGKGKTTLLRLINGDYSYTGNIDINVKTGYFPFETDSEQIALYAAEEIYSAEHWRLVKEMNKLALEEDVLYQPFGQLSKGEQTKLMLAALFSEENEFLLIDEPTTHLDVYGRDKLAEYLAGKSGFILVSHDRDFLDRATDHTVALNNSGAEVQKGNFSSWYENKKRRDNDCLQENQRLRKDIRRLEEAARRATAFADKAEREKIGTSDSVDRGFLGAKAAKMMRSAKNIERRKLSAIEQKSGLLQDIERTDSLKLKYIPYYTDRLIGVDNLAIRYGDRRVFNAISFNIDRGDRVALIGRNGAGKSSLLKLICGEDIAYSGSIKIGGGLKVAYVRQSYDHISGSIADYARNNGADESLFNALLVKMGMSRDSFNKDISALSSGQKKKVMLTAALCSEANLYVFDEPLNYIDVFSRMQIEQMLMDSGASMIFVEHDRRFSDGIATKTVILEKSIE